MFLFQESALVQIQLAGLPVHSCMNVSATVKTSLLSWHPIASKIGNAASILSFAFRTPNFFCFSCSSHEGCALVVASCCSAMAVIAVLHVGLHYKVVHPAWKLGSFRTQLSESCSPAVPPLLSRCWSEFSPRGHRRAGLKELSSIYSVDTGA